MSSTSPKRSSQVVETFRPILCSTLVTKTPLRSPRVAGLEVDVELRHDEQRQALGAGAGALGRASTRCTMLSKMSASAEVMKRLTPLEVPGAVGLLHGLGAPGADVGPGVGLGEHHGGAPVPVDHDAGPAAAAARCRCVHSSLANEKPLEYMWTAGLAPSTISAIAHRRDGGMAVPPSSTRDVGAPELGVDVGPVARLERLRQDRRVGGRVEDRAACGRSRPGTAPACRWPARRPGPASRGRSRGRCRRTVRYPGPGRDRAARTGRTRGHEGSACSGSWGVPSESAPGASGRCRPP